MNRNLPRVATEGFEIWRMGRQCMTFQTPRAFLDGLVVGAAQDSRSKCKRAGTAISKGGLFVALTIGGAKGERPTSQMCSLKSVSALIADVARKAGGKFQVQSVNGFKTLSRDLQKQATMLLVSKGGGGSTSLVAMKRPANRSFGESSVSSKRVKK